MRAKNIGEIDPLSHKISKKILHLTNCTKLYLQCISEMQKSIKEVFAASPFLSITRKNSDPNFLLFVYWLLFRINGVGF